MDAPTRAGATCGTETRWEHENLVDAARGQLGRNPDPVTLRRCTVEHPFGTTKAWMGHAPCLTRQRKNVRTKMALH